MNFIDLAKKRYSVRKYKNTAVDQDKLDIILQAGRVSPTAANRQPNRFLVINTAEGLEKLKKGTNAHGAPLAIIVCGNKDSVWIRPYDKQDMIDVDASIATDHIMMCAEDLGLSSCWLTYFDPQVIREEFNIPSNLVPVNILAIGYSDDDEPQSSDRHEKTRKALEEVVVYNSF